MTHQPTKHKHHRAGYTLVEASLAIAVLAVLSVGAMSLVQHNLQKNQHETTHERLTKINNALENFARRFGYLPCPAQPDLKAGNANYGAATSYNHDSKICDDANLVNEAGAVPVRSLHLDDDVAYDGWNNKFTYRISEYAGAKVDLEENTAFQSSIRISNLSGTPLTHGFDARHNGVLYVLISHGSKAKHATLNEGATTANSDNIVMDKMSARATIGNANHADALYYKGSGEGDFDDIVSYARYNDFFRPTQKLAPFAMPQEFCQNANVILKSGSPKDEGTPLHEFAENNAGMDAFTRNIYTAANRMKTICDASPTEVMAYTPPPPPNVGKFWLGGIHAAAGSSYRWKQVGSADWIYASGGTTAAFGINSDSYLYSIGSNSYGQLGLGHTNSVNSRNYNKIGNSKWLQVASQHYTVGAIRADGTLWTWGYNNYGQLGVGGTGQRNAPTQVTGVPGGDSDWKEIAVSPSRKYAIKNDGSMYAWGWGLSGALGVGSTANHYTPQRIGSDNDWDTVAAGAIHGIAIKTSGRMYSWGHAYGNEGSSTNSPQPVGSATDWKKVGAGDGYNVALKEDGRIFSWGGRNNYGQQGRGGTGTTNTPTQITGVASGDSNWKDIAVSYHHVQAITQSGHFYVWGRAGSGGGLHGLGDNQNHHSPVRVGTDSDWKSVFRGYYCSVALK